MYIFTIGQETPTTALFAGVVTIAGSIIVAFLGSTFLETRRQKSIYDTEKEALEKALYSEIMWKLREICQSLKFGDLSAADDRVQLEQALSSFKTCPVYDSALNQPVIFYQIDDARGIEHFYRTIQRLPTTWSYLFMFGETLLKNSDSDLRTATSMMGSWFLSMLPAPLDPSTEAAMEAILPVVLKAFAENPDLKKGRQQYHESRDNYRKYFHNFRDDVNKTSDDKKSERIEAWYKAAEGPVAEGPVAEGPVAEGLELKPNLKQFEMLQLYRDFFYAIRNDPDILKDDKKFEEMIKKFYEELAVKIIERYEGPLAARYKNELLGNILGLSILQLKMDKLNELMKQPAGIDIDKQGKDAQRIISELCSRKTEAAVSQEGEK